MYAVLNVNGAKVHVVGTHAQATDHICGAGEPARIRSTQFNSIASERYPTDPREDLDHVLHREGHARPSGWTNEVIKEQALPGP